MRTLRHRALEGLAQEIPNLRAWFLTLLGCPSTVPSVTGKAAVGEGFKYKGMS
jgi:hypothetical protein